MKEKQKKGTGRAHFVRYRETYFETLKMEEILRGFSRHLLERNNCNGIYKNCRVSKKVAKNFYFRSIIRADKILVVTLNTQILQHKNIPI